MRSCRMMRAAVGQTCDFTESQNGGVGRHLCRSSGPNPPLLFAWTQSCPTALSLSLHSQARLQL